MKPGTRRTLIVIAIVIVGARLLVFFSGSRGSLATLPTGKGTPAFSIGNNHGVILASDGSLWTWGDSELGWTVLGLGPKVKTSIYLTRIGKETNWVDISAGGSTTLAVKRDGSMWGWGQNNYGQVGDGTTVSEHAFPVQSPFGKDWKRVATSGIHSLAIRNDGSLWAWGNNWAGQLGNGTTNSSRTPMRIGESTNWTRIWADLVESVGQQRDGRLWYWGWDYTQDTNGASIRTPTLVSSDTNWVDVGMGDWMVFAVKSDGTLWAWGRHAHLFSTATNASQDSMPMQVGHESDWRSCAHFASSRPFFMKRDGSLWGLDATGNGGVAVVTKLVQALVINDQLSGPVDNTRLGIDPAFGVPKTLRISYEIDGTNAVTNFAESSPMNLSGQGKKLTITRALYGDVTMFAEADKHPEKEVMYQPATLRRIELDTNIVAFCGGRHGLGAALMANGEAWHWGETLGRLKYPALATIERTLSKIGVHASWDNPPLVLEQPARLGKASGN